MRRLLVLLVFLSIGCSGEYRPYEYLSFANVEGAEIIKMSREPAPNTWVPFAIPTITRIVRDNYQFYIILAEIDGRRAHIRAATLDGEPILIDSSYIWGPISDDRDLLSGKLPKVPMSFLFEWVPGDPDIMEVNVIDSLGNTLWTTHLPFKVVKRGMRHYPKGYHLHGEEL